MMLCKKLMVILALVLLFACKTTQTDNNIDNNQLSYGGGSASLHWPVLFAEALRQAVEIEMGKKLEVITAQADSGLLWGEEVLGTPFLIAYIKDKSQAKNIFAIPILGWRDFIYSINPEMSLFPPDILTINAHVMVFSLEIIDPALINESYHLYRKEISHIVWKLLNVDNRKSIRDFLYTPMPAHLQVTSVTEYNYYVELNVAQPGSRIPENEILSSLAPGKMIVLTIITDWGPIHVRLIAPEKSSAEQDLDQKLYNLYKQTLEQAKSTIKNQVARRQLFFKAKDKLEQILKDSPLFADELYNSLQLELLSLLYLDEWVLREEETLEVFPDYEPKFSEDTVLDYRSALYSQIHELPEAVSQNLKALVNLLTEYKKRALNNPGRFEEGQVMLGADMNQYVPSDEECMESEIGDRIAAIAAEMSPQELRSLLKQQGIEISQMSYGKINYRHVDVMGSGRFFYADEPVEVYILK